MKKFYKTFLPFFLKSNQNETQNTFYFYNFLFLDLKDELTKIKIKKLMEEENKTPKESSIVFKNSLKRKENHETTQIDVKNNFLIDPLETDNKMEKRNDQKKRKP